MKFAILKVTRVKDNVDGLRADIALSLDFS